VQYFCGVLDFNHDYDIHHWRFLSGIGKKFTYLKNFFLVMELEQYVFVSLEHFYCVSDGDSFVTAVYKRFSSIALCRA